MNSDLKRKPEKYYGWTREEMLRYLPPRSRRVLEVGCGEGNFARLVKSHLGCEVWGVELDPANTERAKEGIDRFICGDITAVLADLPDSHFDAIVFNDVLEHLVDPFSLLDRIKPKLSDQGVLVCSLPNLRFFRVFYKFVFKGLWEYTDEGVLDKTHLRFFTKRSIPPFFGALGYRVETLQGIDRTKSLRPLFLNILSGGRFGDLYFLRFAVVARPREQLPAEND